MGGHAIGMTGGHGNKTRCGEDYLPSRLKSILASLALAAGSVRLACVVGACVSMGFKSTSSDGVKSRLAVS